MKKICAIYTRKSTDERLDMEFNSLDAQREACEAYILSQKSEGWVSSAEAYDDGGFSGGSLNRPGLDRLLIDIKAGKVHTVVVYKIDRLTRSLMDFSKLVEIFDERGVTFVSITQSFNTTTSMGRLTLNVLLSFAQFEREVTGERIRDKVAASKRKGMWMGGAPPIGYEIENRQLIIRHDEVHLAKLIFDRYAELGNVRDLKRELDLKNILSPKRISLKGKEHGGCLFSRGALYSILRNPAYIGKIRHREKIYDGLHAGIIDPELWQKVQSSLDSNAIERTEITRHRHSLQGLIFDTNGAPYSPTFTARHNRQYRYYISQNLLQDRAHPKYLIARLPAHEIEQVIEGALRDHLPNMWPGDASDQRRTHFLRNQCDIPTHDLIRGAVAKITIDLETVLIQFQTNCLANLTNRFFQLNLQDTQVSLQPLSIRYSTRKAERGAVVIEAEHQVRDMFAVSPIKLKKLIQGIVWRDEHFQGTALKNIAIKYGHSEGYVGKVIFDSFETLQKYFAV